MPTDPEEPWLLPLLRCLRVRPGMFLGHENVALLNAYLDGCGGARLDVGLSEFGTGEPDHLRGFSEWLRARHGHGRSTIGWADVIQQLDPSERNIGTFFTEFERYLLDRGIDLDAVPREMPPRWSITPA